MEQVNSQMDLSRCPKCPQWQGQPRTLPTGLTQTCRTPANPGQPLGLPGAGQEPHFLAPARPSPPVHLRRNLPCERDRRRSPALPEGEAVLGPFKAAELPRPGAQVPGSSQL